MPRIQMTRPVKIILYSLRIYLIGLLLLLAFMFIRKYATSKPETAPKSPPVQNIQTNKDKE